MSLSTESMLLLIVSILVAAVAVGLITGISATLSDRLELVGDERSDIADTDVVIVSDLGSGEIYNGTDEELILLVRNTGERKVDIDSVNLFVNSELVEIDQATVLDGDPEEWNKKDVLRIKVGQINLDGGRKNILVDTFGADDEVNIFV